MPDTSENAQLIAPSQEGPVVNMPASPTSGPLGVAAKAHDLETIRSSVVEAAGVSAGFWLSYLFALFYFLIATGSVTHKDLFLETPIKLPFLTVDLPLRGFFWLGPAIFLVVHAYVLLHFRLLAGKVRMFDDELRAQIDPDRAESDIRTQLRRQLPSDIFVQLLAGPREIRGGVVGVLLKMIAWISLAIGPVSLMVFFELQFLPYHNAWITWWQRLGVLIDLVLLWLLWPAAAWQCRAWRHWTRFGSAGLASAAPLVLVFLIATFPGEWLEQNLTRVPLRNFLVAGAVNFNTRKPESLWSNRLILPGLDVVNHAVFDGEARLTPLPETASLRARDLRGAVLVDADLRRADFKAADLQDAFLSRAQLQGASFYEAQLQGAWLDSSQLQGAVLTLAKLQGASLTSAQMQGASLISANLQGAALGGAQLQGAFLNSANLQGASLSDAQLQGASLDHADLRGSLLDDAQLQGASLYRVQLQGASLQRVFAWRSNALETTTQGTQISHVTLEPMEPCPDDPLAICDWTFGSLQNLLARVGQQLPQGRQRIEVLARLDRQLDPNKPVENEAAMEQRWRTLEGSSSTKRAYEGELMVQWQSVGCDAAGAPHVVTALTYRMDLLGAREWLRRLAIAFLDPTCVGARGISDRVRTKLERRIPATGPSTTQPSQ